jgi:hypothetical protein
MNWQNLLYYRTIVHYFCLYTVIKILTGKPAKLKGSGSRPGTPQLLDLEMPYEDRLTEP